MNRAQQIEALRWICERSLADFIRYTFKNRDGSKFIVGPVQSRICAVLERVARGEIKRLIINIPPGYSKTEVAVKGFIAWCLARNPRCRFLHLSYGDDVALENSSSIKEVVTSDYYQRLWPLKLKNDSQSKHKWWIESHGGGMYAAASGAAVTGFRAGRDLASTDFSGALIVDDPLKPEDSNSRVKRESINRRFIQTIRSRLVNEHVPIIVIMQRIHQDDLSGILLRGGFGDGSEQWHHLMIPAIIDGGEPYPSENTHGVRIEHGLPDGPAWGSHHTAEQLAALAADKFVFAAQYLQRPKVPGGQLFAVDKFQYYDRYDASKARIEIDDRTINIKSVNIFCDTAHKMSTAADYTALAVWGEGADGRIYLLDLVHDKLEAPALRAALYALLRKWAYRPGENACGVRAVYIEDKASGIGLIQDARAVVRGVVIEPIQRNVDKVSRAYDVAPDIEDGRCVLPVGAPWLKEFLREHEEFSPSMSHRHDDIVDTTCDAVNTLIRKGRRVDYSELMR